jgi:hypothetical protein
MSGGGAALSMYLQMRKDGAFGDCATVESLPSRMEGRLFGCCDILSSCEAPLGLPLFQLNALEMFENHVWQVGMTRARTD